MKAQKCPVCEGRGYVETSFYPDMEGSTEKYTKCRACNGTGIIYVPEEDYFEVEEAKPEKEEGEESKEMEKTEE